MSQVDTPMLDSAESQTNMQNVRTLRELPRVSIEYYREPLEADSYMFKQS